jgi:hypothetical protein
MTDEQLTQFAQTLIEQYKHEIVRDGDWWHGIDGYSFNIHSLEDDHESDGYDWYSINVYKVDPVTGMDNYEWMIDLEPVFLGETTV